MKFCAVLWVSLMAFPAWSQSIENAPASENKSGSFYFTWGYHRNSYSRSTLRLRDHKSDDYDFTLYHAKANDQPDFSHLLKRPPTVPQYVMRLGYFFNNKKDLGIEFSWDHLKYVVEDNQMMHLTGTIRGTYYDTDTLVTPGFVHFEHTNGNNYAMISIVKRHKFFESKNRMLRISALFTGGAGILVPKTDSYILGNHNDGPFRFSGIVFGASAGLRIDFLRVLFLESSVKGAFADYTNAKVYLDGRARHSFFSAQYVVATGITIPLSWKD